MRKIEMTGKRFGLLVVTGTLTGSQCVADCACGTTGFITEGYSVRNGLTTSCGCRKNSGESNLKHGESVAGNWTPEYMAWVNMLTRCRNPNATGFKNWGGRGITVCIEWRADYPAFLAHVGRRTSPAHSLDRFPNPDGNYEPGNVRWATGREQEANKKPRKKAA